METVEIKALLKDFYGKIDEDNCSLFDLNMKNSILNADGEVKDYISEKVIGIALYSIFNAVKKTRDFESKKKIAELNSCDEYFGNVGDKFKGHPLSVTLLKISSFETQFGYTYIWNMKDDEGHTIVWFSSSHPCCMANMIENELVDELRPYCFDKFHKNIRELELEGCSDKYFVETITKIRNLQKVEKAIDEYAPVKFNLVGGSIKDHSEYTDRFGVTTKQTIVTRCKVDGWEVA